MLQRSVDALSVNTALQDYDAFYAKMEFWLQYFEWPPL